MNTPSFQQVTTTTTTIYGMEGSFSASYFPQAQTENSLEAQGSGQPPLPSFERLTTMVDAIFSANDKLFFGQDAFFKKYEKNEMKFNDVKAFGSLWHAEVHSGMRKDAKYGLEPYLTVHSASDHFFFNSIGFMKTVSQETTAEHFSSLRPKGIPGFYKLSTDHYLNGLGEIPFVAARGLEIPPQEIEKEIDIEILYNPPERRVDIKIRSKSAHYPGVVTFAFHPGKPYTRPSEWDTIPDDSLALMLGKKLQEKLESQNFKSEEEKVWFNS